jgi:hypothetical protein
VLTYFEGGPMDGRVGEYDLDDEAMLFDHRNPGPAVLYRRSDRTTQTEVGRAVVYIYVGSSLLT